MRRERLIPLWCGHDPHISRHQAYHSESCFIEDTGVVIGDVVMGEHCSIWFNTVIRGDVHYIRLGNRTNVQDLCMLHVTHDTHPLIIGSDVTVGHSVVLHGCTIKDRVLIGMGAIIMDGAVIGEDSVVGAGALVTEGTIVPPKSLILGSPAKIARPVTTKNCRGSKNRRKTM